MPRSQQAGVKQQITFYIFLYLPIQRELRQTDTRTLLIRLGLLYRQRFRQLYNLRKWKNMGQTGVPPTFSASFFENHRKIKIISDDFSKNLLQRFSGSTCSIMISRKSLSAVKNFIAKLCQLDANRGRNVLQILCQGKSQCREHYIHRSFAISPGDTFQTQLRELGV